MKLSDSILLSFASLIILITGCASPSPAKAPLTKDQILLQEDVSGKSPVVFSQRLDEVRQAGLRSLVFVGCEVKTQDPLFLSGRRPNKIGLFVGSGGETVEVFLYPQSEYETHVWVDTDLSFVGIAGQQDWSKKVVDQMSVILNKTASK